MGAESSQYSGLSSVSTIGLVTKEAHRKHIVIDCVLGWDTVVVAEEGAWHTRLLTLWDWKP